MRAPLYIFRDPPLDGPTNMARDEHLLHGPRWSPAALRIYGWSPPTLSLGCFQRFDEIGGLADDVQQWAVVRRPTGGGAILHDREVTYCLTLDAAHPLGRAAPAELYRVVHSIWQRILAASGLVTELAPDHFPLPSPRSGPFYCFAKPGRTDLITAAGKVLGSAQRRLPTRIMQHGSLLLAREADHPGADLGNPQDERVAGWIDDFIAGLAAELDLQPTPTEWPADAAADIAARRAHYLDPAWTRKR